MDKLYFFSIAFILLLKCGAVAAEPSTGLTLTWPEATVQKQQIAPIFLSKETDSLNDYAKNSKTIQVLNKENKNILRKDLKLQFSDKWQMMANGAGRGGGGTVYCSASKANRTAGYYALDYLLRTGQVELSDSFDEISENIYSQLNEFFPALALSYKFFLASFFEDNRNELKEGIQIVRKWQIQKSMNHLPDEEMTIADKITLSSIPKNCFVNGELNIRQTVIRQRLANSLSPDEIQYEFNFKIIDHLRKNKPVQFSFLMVHEWLRDFVTSARTIRKLNEFLHSKEFLTLQGNALKARFLALGLSNDKGFLKSRDEFEKHLEDTAKILVEFPGGASGFCVSTHYFSGLQALRNKANYFLSICRDHSLQESQSSKGCADYLDVSSEISSLNLLLESYASNPSSSQLRRLAPACLE